MGSSYSCAAVDKTCCQQLHDNVTMAMGWYFQTRPGDILSIPGKPCEIY